MIEMLFCSRKIIRYTLKIKDVSIRLRLVICADGGKNMSIDKAFAELEEKRKNKTAAKVRLVLNAKKEIEDWTGRAYCGDCTYAEAVSYIVHKYLVRKISFTECLEYIRPELKNEVLRQKDGKRIDYLTEDYASGEDLKDIFLLPPRGAAVIDGCQKDGCVLFLCEQEGRLSQWSFEGNTRGYNILNIELYILHNSIDTAMYLAKQ